MLYLCRNIVRMFLWQNDKNVYNKFYKTKSIKTTVLHMGRINIPAISIAGWSPKRPKYPLSFSGTETQYSSLKGVVHSVVENNLITYNIYFMRISSLNWYILQTFRGFCMTLEPKTLQKGGQLQVLRVIKWGLDLSEISHLFKGVVRFKRKTFADNLLTPMSSKMSMSFFLHSKRN